MRAKVSVFIATSLDGFIARKDGSVDWLEKANTTMLAGEDCGYESFFESIDALVLGRKTFELASSFKVWPYGGRNVIVLSKTLKTVPTPLENLVSLTSLSPQAVIEKLSHEGSRHIYLDGGRTIQSFLVEQLVDEMTITTIPILLGEGIQLFGKLASDIELVHLKTHSYPNGFVQSKYRVQY